METERKDKEVAEILDKVVKELNKLSNLLAIALMTDENLDSGSKRMLGQLGVIVGTLPAILHFGDEGKVDEAIDKLVNHCIDITKENSKQIRDTLEKVKNERRKQKVDMEYVTLKKFMKQPNLNERRLKLAEVIKVLNKEDKERAILLESVLYTTVD